jgi:tetratricopeptide (TPR) repeat protein
MGGKPSRTRERLNFCLALLIGVGGCTILKGAPQVKTAPAPVLIPAPEPMPESKVTAERLQARVQREADEHLALARDLLSKGDFDGALRENQKVLSLAKDQPPADAAVFNMGLIYADPKNPRKNNRQAISYFSRVVKTHPESMWAGQAKIWVAVLDGMEKLKQVDLEIEEKRRDRTR